MKNKTLIFIILLLIVTLSVFFYFQNSRTLKTNTNLLESRGFRFGLLTGLGGLGDRGFNDMQFNGMILARRNYGIEYEYAFPKTAEDNVELIAELIKKNCNVIILGGGYHAIEPLDYYSKNYPEILFVILDDVPLEYRPNVASILFRQNEGSFLAGVIAGLMTETNNLGVVGGMDIAVIRDFYVGFSAGARYVNPEISIHIDFIDHHITEGIPWANPIVAYELSELMYYEHNVDILFAAAGASSMGVYNLAREKNIYAVGVDSNQDYLAEGTILTSMMKNLDIAINYIVGEILEGNFENKRYSMGLKEGGVSLSPMAYTRELIGRENLEMVSKIENMIINKELLVPSSYER